jgi:hypothetical protein
VDDVEVDMVDAQPFQAPLRLSLRVLPRRIELRGDEDLSRGTPLSRSARPTLSSLP